MNTSPQAWEELDISYLITVANEDEIVLIETVDGDYVEALERFYGEQGYYVTREVL